MPLILALAPAILQLLMMILKWFAEKSVNDKEKERFYNAFTELARVLNLPDLVKKYKLSEDQLKANEDKWDEIEKYKEDKKP